MRTLSVCCGCLSTSTSFNTIFDLIIVEFLSLSHRTQHNSYHVKFSSISSYVFFFIFVFHIKIHFISSQHLWNWVSNSQMRDLNTQIRCEREENAKKGNWINESELQELSMKDMMSTPTWALFQCALLENFKCIEWSQTHDVLFSTFKSHFSLHLSM
jgi:hypothetical protein